MKIYSTIIIMSLTAILSCGMSNSKEQNEINNLNDSTLKTGWYYIVDDDNGFKRQLDKDTLSFFIDPNPIVTAKNIKKFSIYESNFGDIGLSMQLDQNGTKLWSEATFNSIGRRLAFIVDDKLLHTPQVMGQITAGITSLNRGVYTKQELEDIQKNIEKSTEK